MLAGTQTQVIDKDTYIHISGRRVFNEDDFIFRF